MLHSALLLLLFVAPDDHVKVSGRLESKHRRDVVISDDRGKTFRWRVDAKTSGLAGVLVRLRPTSATRTQLKQPPVKLPKSSRIALEKRLAKRDYRVTDRYLRQGVIVFGSDSVRPAIAGVFEGQQILLVNESAKPKRLVRAEGLKKVYGNFEMPPRSVVSLTVAAGERYVFVADLVSSRAQMTALVMQNRLWAITDSTGAFEIDDVPPGEYRIDAVRYETLNLRTCKAADMTEPLRIEVRDVNLDLGAFVLEIPSK